MNELERMWFERICDERLRLNTLTARPWSYELEDGPWQVAGNEHVVLCVSGPSGYDPIPDSPLRNHYAMTRPKKPEHETDLELLRRWLGFAEWSTADLHDGIRALRLPASRPGRLYGVGVDCNLVARAIGIFQGPSVYVRAIPADQLLCLVDGGPRDAFAWVKGMSNVGDGRPRYPEGAAS